MSDGTLLVLGASHHQLDVIMRARRRGIRVVVVDNQASNPGHRVADASHLVDTTDIDSVEAVARAEAVEAIVAPCTDVAVPTAAVIAARLELPGVAPGIATLVTSKLAFRRWQREGGLPSTDAFECSDGVSPPGPDRWIVKPDMSSGSKGIRIVDNLEQLPSALEAARTLGAVVLVERFIEGHQVTVEGMVRRGELAWAVVLDRQTASPPWCATTGHRLPTLLPHRQAAAAIEAVTATVRALDLEEGLVDADLVVADEVVVLELSPRLGGNSIAALLELATGVDLADAAIDLAFGVRSPTPPPTPPRPCAVVLLGAERVGVLTYDAAETAALQAEPWVAKLELAPQGTPVRPFVDGRAAVGRIFITGEGRVEVDARADEALARLALGAT